MAPIEGGILLNMKRARLLFLTVSVAVMMLFTGVLLANRSNQDVLFRALGNLAEVVHLVETEYVDELNQEALAQSLDAGLVEPLNWSAAVLPVDRIGDYLEFVDVLGFHQMHHLGEIAKSTEEHVLIRAVCQQDTCK